jgi:hypothetical protein
MKSAILFLVWLLLAPLCAFQIPSTASVKSGLGSVSSADIVEAVQGEPQNDAQLVHMITALESIAESISESISDDNPDRFKPLIGLYDVSYIKTRKPRDNPVGGKWTRKNGIAQKILRTRRTFQHILPANTTTTCRWDAVGEAVNVVSLEAFWGLLRLTVILRGDAVPLTLEERTNTSRVVQPLSPLAVKALFDPPRIILGRKGRFFNINVGPTTSVLLDTTFCDDKVRIGMGGTSGTRFVFARCADDDVEANEFRGLLEKEPIRKSKALVVLGALASVGLYGAVAKQLRFVGGAVFIAATLLGAALATSSGGIEDNDRSVQFRKEEDVAAATVTPL